MNIIDAFFGFYTYNIIEIVSTKSINLSTGQALAFRSEKPYQTTIKKAIEYNYKYDLLSHRTLAQYKTFLKDGQKRSIRESEKAYYPFMLEFEGNTGNEIKQSVIEVIRTVEYLAETYAINSEDLLFMISPKKSIYLYINPKIYNLRPVRYLHRVYEEMAKEIKNTLSLKTLDTSMYDYDQLVKMPNAAYAGGYVVPGTYEDIELLHIYGEEYRKRITRNKRALDWTVPGIESIDFTDFFNQYLFKSRQNPLRENRNKTNIKEQRACVKYTLEQKGVEHGQRNHVIVSYFYDAKDRGLSEDEAIYNFYDQEYKISLQDLYDPITERNIKQIAKSIYRSNKTFKCDTVKSLYGEQLPADICSGCQYQSFCQTEEVYQDFIIYTDAIKRMFELKASTRHFKAYLWLAYNKYLIDPNKKLLDSNIEDKRVIRELETIYGVIKRHKSTDGIYIESAYIDKKYKVPNDFIHMVDRLGQRLGQFLRLLVMTYKPIKSGLLLGHNRETIMKILGIGKSAFYKMFNDFKNLKLITRYKKSFRISFGVTLIRKYVKSKDTKIEQQNLFLVINGSNIPIENSSNLLINKATRGPTNNISSLYIHPY